MPDIGKGWRATFSRGDGQKENILNVFQVPDLPWPIVKPAGCTFKFPSNGHINYLTRRAQGAKKNYEMKFKVEGDAKFIPLDGGPFAAAHLYFEEGAPMINAWWATWTTSIILQDVIGKGVQTVKIPLTPEYWGNIVGQSGNYNKSTQDAFAKSLKEMGHCGITFGGRDGGYGHGVKIKDGGKATFTIVSAQFVD